VRPQSRRRFSSEKPEEPQRAQPLPAEFRPQCLCVSPVQPYKPGSTGCGGSEGLLLLVNLSGQIGLRRKGLEVLALSCRIEGKCPKAHCEPDTGARSRSLLLLKGFERLPRDPRLPFRHRPFNRPAGLSCFRQAPENRTWFR